MADSYMGAQRALYSNRFALGTPKEHYGIDNATWLTARNAANTADVNMIRVNASGETEVATGTSTVQSTKIVSLTNANIKNLRATPITLVAAPGTGKTLEFVSAILVLKAGTNALTETTYNLAVKYTNGSGAAVSQTIETTGFIDQTANTITTAQAKIDAIVAVANAENKALVLHNTGAGEFGGNAANDATMKVVVTYRVHTGLSA